MKPKDLPASRGRHPLLSGMAQNSPVRFDEEDFPGCVPKRIPRRRIRDYSGRFEFWDANTETAMICEPTSYYHEVPSQRLARLTERIAQFRGSAIDSCGTVDLLLRNAAGERQRILQADQVLYLRPGQVERWGHSIEVHKDRLPDVVLEVDNTTDVRRRKLGLYEEWGFPEIWVEVPDEPARGRAKSRPSGLMVHLLGPDGRYREALVSQAFPTWTAKEIHVALNEKSLSLDTLNVLRRVGQRLGEQEGTTPNDDPQIGAERRDAHAQGHAEGYMEGLNSLHTFVAGYLARRGIKVSPEFNARFKAVGPLTGEALLLAAQKGVSEQDFFSRLRQELEV
ncbi:MAG: Uma2 family endonuclease [Gammaproteobacteria bacterium]|nr:Uma2 family endonuclease [Gammaproteobacteria bacterium]MDD9963310.1 Uma2 family endonuclease [Gammaproteobacteria bacterium]MDE0270178.1 Uma2 family endonuclease [Gammaproteobacteria bacterium]